MLSLYVLPYKDLMLVPLNVQYNNPCASYYARQMFIFYLVAPEEQAVKEA